MQLELTQNISVPRKGSQREEGEGNEASMWQLQGLWLAGITLFQSIGTYRDPYPTPLFPRPYQPGAPLPEIARSKRRAFGRKQGNVSFPSNWLQERPKYG